MIDILISALLIVIIVDIMKNIVAANQLDS